MPNENVVLVSDQVVQVVNDLFPATRLFLVGSGRDQWKTVIRDAMRARGLVVVHADDLDAIDGVAHRLMGNMPGGQPAHDVLLFRKALRSHVELLKVMP